MIMREEARAGISFFEGGELAERALRCEIEISLKGLYRTSALREVNEWVG